MIRRLLVWVPLLLLAILLAVWFADAVQDQLIAPAAYLLWLLGLFLRSVSASIYWGILLGVVALIVLASLLGGLRFRRRAREERTRIQGPVEQAAALVRGARRGPYFRWLVARRLGELAHAALMPPDDAALPSAGLRRAGWTPPPAILAFLEAGLDRPPLGRMSRTRFRAGPTPLDAADVDQVVEYLESQMEMRE
jgi:MFS superfamily sulfate permease-like transporter